MPEWRGLFELSSSIKRHDESAQAQGRRDPVGGMNSKNKKGPQHLL